MGIFSSTSAAICGVMDTITDVAVMGGETVSMGTTYVHNRAVEQKLTDVQLVRNRTAKAMRVIQEELAADDDLKAIYDSLAKEFA